MHPNFYKIAQRFFFLLILILPYISTAQDLRHFDEGRLQAFREEFSVEEKVNPRSSGNWFGSLFESFFETIESGGNALLIILICLFVFIIVLFLYKNFRGKRTKSIPFDMKSAIENIDKMSFDPLIEKAVASKDFSSAVRYSFLKTLKLLSDQKMILLMVNKTNVDYSYELSNTPSIQQSFDELRRWFDYTFYGDFKIDHVAYSRVESLFQQFYQNINNKTP